LKGEHVVHVLDLMHDDAYREGDPNRRALEHLTKPSAAGRKPLIHTARSRF
jgi:hypothetical protein